MHEGISGLFWITDDSITSETRGSTARSDPIQRTADQRRAVVESLSRIHASNTFDWYGTPGTGTRPMNYIFKVKVDEKRKLRHSGSIGNNAISLNYAFNDREAVVSNSCDAFDTMVSKAAAYADTGKNKTRFDDFTDLSPNTGEWKLSRELAEDLDNRHGNRRVRLQMVPGIEDPDRSMWMDGIHRAIESNGGSVLGTNDTGGLTFVYAEADPETIRRLGDCPAVLSLMSPAVATVDDVDPPATRGTTFVLDPSVDVRSKRTVTLFDNGVDFPPELSDVVVEHIVSPGLDDTRGRHGTMVASKLVFGNLDDAPGTNVLRPRCSLIDYKIIDGEEDCSVLADRIREGVEALHDRCSVFVLCINVRTPFMGEDNEISVAIDELHSRYGVRFFVSMGNHDLWKVESDMGSILDDSDSGLAAPADAVSAVSVGAAVGTCHMGSISPADGPAPYSRFGPGPLGCVKPNVVGLSGTVLADGTVPRDRHSAVLSPDGLTEGAGTSFSNPDVAGLFAMVSDAVGDSGTLMSLALMYHFARISDWEPGVPGMNPRNVFGFGIVDERILGVDPRREAVLLRQSSIRAGEDETVSITLPEEVRALACGNRDLGVRVTCLTDAVIDRSRGADMVRSTVDVALKGRRERSVDGGSVFWDVCIRRSYHPGSLDGDGWQLVLRAYGKDGMKGRMVPYALVVSLEDLSGRVDVAAAVRDDGRYPVLGSVDSRVGVGTRSASRVAVSPAGGARRSRHRGR